MSRENLESVRKMYEAFNRGDFEAALSILHPEAELHQPQELPDTDSYYGVDEFQRGITEWISSWDDPRFEPLEVRAVGDRVVMHVRVAGRGRGSGLQSEADAFHVWDFEDGSPRCCRVYWSWRKALEAAGLRE